MYISYWDIVARLLYKYKNKHDPSRPIPMYYFYVWQGGVLLGPKLDAYWLSVLNSRIRHFGEQTSLLVNLEYDQIVAIL
jgi:hypothetical protein